MGKSPVNGLETTYIKGIFPRVFPGKVARNFLAVFRPEIPINMKSKIE
jgi:hypothetical protein